MNEQINDEMSRELEACGPGCCDACGGAATAGETRGWSYAPHVDIVELDDAYLIEADLPGATRERIELTVDEGVLTIQAPIAPRETGRQRVDRQEYGSGGFHRRFRLDRDIDATAIDATYEMGVLTVRLPKSVASRPRRIQVS